MDIEGYVQEELVQKPDMIGKNVRALGAAVEEDGVLQDLVGHFACYMEQDPEMLETMHSVTRGSIRRRGHDDIVLFDLDGK